MGTSNSRPMELEYGEEVELMSMEQVLQMILHIIYMITQEHTVILTITDTNDCQHSDTNTAIVRPNPIPICV